MRRFSPILLLASLLALACGNLRAQEAADPAALVEWLRTLVIEARLDLKFPEEGRPPRLFSETVPDGRTWMIYIADTLGVAAGGDPSQPNVPNQWALLDEAVTIALAEADKMKALAAARAGTSAEAQFQTMRRNYLLGAARMLQAYKVAAVDVFDSTAGALADPFGLPDWLLPGEIQIKEVGGAGRLNTDSGDFSGRLSGTMLLPGLGATLVVPNASFDSDGRFDLSAYGNVRLPVGVLSIPARQPLHYRSTPERGQLLEGSARLTLTNGLRFDASMLLADPNYCFGLAARGLEFDLGKSLLVRVPALNLNQVNAFGDATRDAFANYFLGLNGAMQTLLTAATNFPPIHETEFGQPPDFKPPQITADFSVLNAWSSEIIAKTRAGLVNAQQNLQPVLDSVAKLNADAREATNALADERFRLGNLAARFDLRQRMKEAAELAAAQQLSGNADISRLQQELVAGARQEGSNIVALITPELPDRLGESAEIVRLLLENASTFQRLGINPPQPALSSDPCVACRAPEAAPQQRAEALALCAARRQATRFGLNPLTGGIANQTVFESLPEAELYRAGRILAEMEAALTSQGVPVQGSFTQLFGPILNRQRELLLGALESESSLQRSFELITLIGDNFADSQGANLPVDGDALLARLETAVAPRLVGVPPTEIDAARKAANQALELRRRQISSEVAQITGRYRSIGVIPPGDPYHPDILTQWDRFFQLVARPVPPGIGTSMDAYVRFKVEELRARPFSIEFLTNRLGEAQAIASGIIGLTDWADTRLSNDFAVLDNLRFAITNFAFEFTAAAELQQAWWLIDRYQNALRQHATVYGANLNAGLRAAEQKSRDAALLASSRVAAAFTNLMANILTHQDVVVPLPGKVELTRLFGRLCFNRHTGFMEGCFGGRVEFPEIGTNVFFDISRACLSSDGSYQIAAATTTPLPIGRMELSSTLAVSGSPAGVASFNGQGTLKIDTGGGLAAGPSVTVGLGYDSAQRRMSLTTAAGQLRLSDQVALLQGSIGAEFSTALPQGALTIAGKIGLLARAPLPANVALSGTNFWLVIDALPTQFRFTERDFTAEFTGGSITLPPDLFSTNGPSGRQPVTVGITGRLCVRYDYALNRLEFCGTPGQPFLVALQNLQLQLPELPGFGLAINNATLELSGTQFPLLKNLSATLSLPLPGADAEDTNQNRLVSVVVSAQDWRIDGLPGSASVTLGSDLQLANFNGFTFDLLNGSGLGLARTGSAGQPRITFTLTGNLRGGFDQRVLTQDADGSAVRLTGGGSFAWDMHSLPVFTFSTVQLEGNFRLGADGPRITGLQQGGLARLSLSGLENVFHQSPQRLFIIGVEGALEVPGVIKFGLLNTQFILDGSGLKFIPGGVQAELGNQSLDLVQDALPVYLRKAGLTFKNSALPLVPAANQPGLFDLANLIVTISGGVNLPNKVAIDAGTPGFAGEVNDLAMSLRRDPQGNLQPEFNLNGLGVALQNVDIPPLGGLTGGLYVGNLNDPANLYFAGTVGGTVNDVGAEVTLALHRQKGFLGACFELDVGPAGIPIDGGTLGGILLTGGKGGLSFGNEFADPCDFRTYIQFASVNGTNQPVNDGMSDGFPPTGSPPPTEVPPAPQGATPGPNTCIVGEFPPSTINPLCERLPSNPNRIIFKGTALNAQQLAALGFTSATCPSTLEAAVAFAVGKIAQPLRDTIHALTNAVPPTVPVETRKFYTELLTKQLRQLENTASGILTATLGDALDLNPNASLYNAIVNAAAQGIPCLDATLKLQGNFSHAAVSTVMKGEGSVTVSTTGTALMQGTVRLIGIPIGEGTLAFSLTDSQGSVNPSFGGVVHAGIGPLVFGDMSLRYECDGCFDTVINAFGVFLQQNASNLGSDVRAMLVGIMNRSVPLGQPRDPGGNLLTYYNALTPRQRMGFVVSLFNVVDVFASGQSLQGISSQAVAGFSTTFRNFVMSVLTQVNPVFCFQAKVRPTIFGFPMIPGPTPLDARFGYARGVDPANGGDYQELSASAIFSPSFIMAALSGLPGTTLLPASDQVNFGFAFRTPAFTADRVDLLLTNPPAFFGEQAGTFIQDAVMTFGYTFMPLGIPLADGQARVVMPRLASHPSNPARVGGAWQPPAGAGIARPEDVIIAALVRGQLQNPNWRGQRGELDDLFAPFNPPPASDTPQARLAALSANINRTTMQQFSLAEDYFPHGGFIGAAQLQLPKMLASTPPVALFGRVLDVSNPNWLADAQELFDDYLTENAVVGQMGLYLPAPNPIGFGFATNSPQGLLDAIGRADVFSIVQQTAPQGLYAVDRVLMAGWIKAQVLGLPLGEGLVVLTNSQFLARLAVSDSWLTNFIQASAEVQIRPPAILANNTLPGSSISNMYANAPRKSVQERFAERRGQLNGNPGAQFIADTVDLIEGTLPKASIETAANVQIPPFLAPVLKAQSGAAISFFAFSPAFEPEFGLLGPGPEDDDNSPYAVAKRRGGAGIKGAFDLGLNLHDGNAANDLRISIPDASFSITPDADIGLFPALNGQLKVADINLPFMPRLRNGRLNFSSSPGNLAPFIAIAGAIDPFEILVPNPFGQNIPMVQFKSRGGPGSPIGGELVVFRDNGVPGVGAGARLLIQPMRVNMPMLGPNVAMTIYGGITNGNVLLPFRFSSSPGDRWSATVKIHAANNENGAPQFGICDPRQVTQDGQGNWIGSPEHCAMTFNLNAPIIGSAEGVGFETFRLAVTLPKLTNVTFFPGRDTETTLPAMGAGSSAGLIMIEKTQGDGLPRFYLDLGTNNIGLPGVLHASSRIEFGYNPTAVPGVITRAPATLNFGTNDICGTNPAVRQLTISNLSSEPVNVFLSVSLPAYYTLAESQFALGRNGGSRTVDVFFHPRTNGVLNATLTIASDSDTTPTVTASLTGRGSSTARYFQSRDSIAFGDTLAGDIASGTVVVANEGCTNMVINSATLSGADAAFFRVTTSGSSVVGPGQSRLYRVEFAPTTLPVLPLTALPHSATLTIRTSVRTNTVALSGNSTDSRWLTLLDAQTAGSSATLNSIHMLDSKNGWAVGNSGTVLETKDGGRSWRSRVLTPFNLRSVNSEAALTTPVLAAYHFEEPPEATQFRDDGPNGFHARAEVDTATSAATNSLANGRIGGGLGFDGVDDAAYIASPLVLPASASIALWVNPSSATASDVLLAQSDTSAIATLFSLETAGTAGYRVRFGGSQLFTGGGAVTAGWQHLVVTLAFNSGLNQTTVRLLRNGTQLWTTNFTGALPASASDIWGIGARYQTLSSRTSFFTGQIDELMFFSGVLTSTEIAALADGNGAFRLMIAGDEGTLLQSETLGRVWHKAADLNVDGFRPRLELYNDYDWLDVVVGGSFDKIVLGGARRVGIASFGEVMVEDLFDLAPFSIIGNERYDEASFPTAPDGVFNALVRNSSSRVYAFTSGGQVFQSNGGNLTNDWTRHGTLDLGQSINDATMVGSSSYVAVGNAGQTLRSVNGAIPIPGTNETTASLRGVAWAGTTLTIEPEVHAVGDGGVYLRSTDLGANWVAAADGLVGNNRSISVRPVGGTNYEAWTAGDQHRIQYRPPLPLTNGFITFHPGELDFGMLTRGGSKTLPVEIRNRGRRDMQNVNVTISGTGFSLVQAAGISRIAPGDAMIVQVRYKPTAAIVQAHGALQIMAADSGGTFTVPLIGRASDLEWQPVALSSGGVALSGQVIDLAFTTDTIGYALLIGRIMKTTDGGLTWTNVSPTPGIATTSFGFRSLEVRRVGSADILYLAGLTSVIGGFPPTRGTIWRSGDGGVNWVTRTPPISGFGTGHPPFGDIAAVHDDANAIVCVTSDPTGLGADVWQSSDGGVNWTTRTRPPDQTITSTTTNDSFGGGRVYIEEVLNTTPASAGWVVVATEGGAVYSRGFNNEWPYTAGSTSTGEEMLQFDTLQPIRAMQFGRDGFNLLNRGWIVGAQGLFWRWAPLGADRNPFAASESEWVPAPDQEVFGRTDLEALSFARYTNSSGLQYAGWVVGGSKIFASRDSGASWFLDFDTGESNVVKSVFTRSRTNAWAGGAIAGKSTVWRYRPGAIPAQGILSVNDVELFSGSLAPGATGTRAVTLRNIGNAPLALQHIGFDDLESSSRFRIVGDAPTNLAVNATATLTVAFDATPDPVSVEALAPRFLHRFEQGFTDTRFFDAGALYADIQLDGARLVPTNNRPRIVFERARRDRSLRFDGNDYAEVPGISNFVGDFSVSFWVNPTTANDDQVFVSKHSSTGADRLLIGYLNGGYHVRIQGVGFEGGDKRTGWQHIAVTGARTTTNTIVTVYRDGELLWQQGLGAFLGNAAGLPWLLGAERDSASIINDFLTGSLDDVGLWDRLLTETEIQSLASKSPACGEHLAKIVYQTDSESGERTTELRATVAESAGAIVIETVPAGVPVLVDGVSYPTPVTFAVGCTASTPKEWLEGSQHTIEAPASVALAAGANTLSYGFADWSLENIDTRTVKIVARPELGRVVARYRLDVIDSPGAAMAFAAAEQPLIQAASIPADLTALVGGTPQGPWFRMTGGNITISNIGGSGFAVTGELFASLTRIKGSLASTTLDLPSGSAPVVEIGAANWQLDLLAGQYFRMRARPPSLSIVGRDIAPDGEFSLDFNFADASYTAGFALLDDFRPAPNFLEVGKNSLGRAGVSATVSFPSGQSPRFEMTLDGRVRALRLPADIPGESGSGWAVQRDVAFRLDTANFNLSLKTNIVGVGSWPATLFSGGPFALNTASGDFRIVRVNNGPIFALLTNMSLSVNGQTAATVSGSVGSDFSLNLNGRVAANSNVRMRNNARFTVEGRNDGPLDFQFGIAMLPPRMILDLPPARLVVTPGGGVDALGVNVPGIKFDTSGAFDTGRIPLPTGLVFDGINVNKPTGASLENNHVRLQRDTDGKVEFKLRARHLFEIAGVVSCRNQLKVTIDNNVSGSYRGNFCVLPEPISLSFDAGRPCQFRGSGFDHTIYFGTGCVGIKNNTTDVCLGECP